MASFRKTNQFTMNITCPECKNSVDLTSYPEIAGGSVIECNHCGITLEVKEAGDDLTAEVIDEGK
jgi:ribosomal protein S27E